MRSHALLALSLLALLPGPASAGEPPASRRSAPPMTEFKVESLEGRILDSRELRGRVLLIDVWATWCGPCRVATPALDRMYSDLRDRGLEMMGVAVRSGSADEVAQAAREMGMRYPVVLWSDELAASLGELEALPTYILVAPDWTVAATYVGATSPRLLRKHIEELLPATQGGRTGSSEAQ